MNYRNLLSGLILGVLLVVGGNAAAATLTVRADYWPPFNGHSKDMKPGYMIEVLREIYTPLGVAIDYDVMPWVDSLAQVRKGDFDAVVGASTSDAPGFIYPAEPFGSSSTMFFRRQGNAWTYKGIESLATVRLGVIEAYSYSEELDEYIEAQAKSGPIVAVSSEDPLPELVQMLRDGKVDVLVEDPSVMTFTLLNMKIPLGQVVRAGDLEGADDIFIAFSPARKTSKEYARQFDEGIRKLRANGRLKFILSRYGLGDWK